MDELRSYYRSRLKLLFVPIVGFAIVYKQFIIPAIDQWYRLHNITFGESWLKGSDSALVGLLFLGGEWAIRTKLWKLEKPHLNFSGLWRGKTIYTKVEVDSAMIKSNAFTAFGSEHKVLIEQDCLSISIKPTGQAFAVWFSIAMTINSKDEIAYAYKVKYEDRKQFPAEAVGYEQMNVMKRTKFLWRWGEGRPIELAGTFAHCAQGQTPVYSGTVTFNFVK